VDSSIVSEAFSLHCRACFRGKIRTVRPAAQYSLRRRGRPSRNTISEIAKGAGLEPPFHVGSSRREPEPARMHRKFPPGSADCALESPKRRPIHQQRSGVPEGVSGAATAETGCPATTSTSQPGVERGSSPTETSVAHPCGAATRIFTKSPRFSKIDVLHVPARWQPRLRYPGRKTAKCCTLVALAESW